MDNLCHVKKISVCVCVCRFFLLGMSDGLEKKLLKEKLSFFLYSFTSSLKFHSVG